MPPQNNPLKPPRTLCYAPEILRNPFENTFEAPCNASESTSSSWSTIESRPKLRMYFHILLHPLISYPLAILVVLCNLKIHVGNKFYFGNPNSLPKWSFGCTRWAIGSTPGWWSTISLPLKTSRRKFPMVVSSSSTKAGIHRLIPTTFRSCGFSWASGVCLPNVVVTRRWII